MDFIPFFFFFTAFISIATSYLWYMIRFTFIYGSKMKVPFKMHLFRQT